MITNTAKHFRRRLQRAFRPDTSASADREKRNVALTSVVAAVFLTGMKVVVGVMTGSLGILSEAAHSGLDLVAAVVTLFAVRASAKPADERHTYGHGKVENLSALFETFLLLVTCVWIVYEATRRLFFHEVDVDVTPWSFIVIVASIGIDWSRSTALMRVAKKYNSQALEADALHFSTDIWSSSVVLFGLFMVLLAHVLKLPWLIKADAVAALVVAGIVIWVSIRLGKKTVDDLLDAVPAHVVDSVLEASKVPGVSEVKRVRVRRSGPSYFADVILSVNREHPLASAHEIAHQAEESIRRSLPEADVVVHIEPAGQTNESTVEKIRDIAARHALLAHAIAVSSADKEGSVEMHLEVDPALSVADAHEKVTMFERDLHETLPRFPAITTHIEPRGGDVATKPVTKPGDEEQVKDLLRRFSRGNKLAVEIHDLKVRKEDGKLAVTFHCLCDGRMKISEAHDLTEKIESRLRKEIRDVGRVVIHIEPLEEERV